MDDFILGLHDDMLYLLPSIQRLCDKWSYMSPCSAALRTSLLLVLLILGGLNCSDTARSEIIIVVDTDLSSPTDITSIRVNVADPSDEERFSTTESLSPNELPAYVGIARTTSPLGPYDIYVTGLLGETAVIARFARVNFISESTRVIELPLLRSCLGVICDQGQTCGVSGCRPVDIDPSEFTEWTGTPPSLDPDASLDADIDSETDAEN